MYYADNSEHQNDYTNSGDTTDLRLTTEELSQHSGRSPTTIRKYLDTYERITHRSVPRNLAGGRSIPWNIVTLLDEVITILHDHASFQDALMAALEVTQLEDVGIIGIEQGNPVEVTAYGQQSIDPHITDAIRLLIAGAVRDQVNATSQLQERSLEISHRLDLADRDSAKLVRDLNQNVQAIYANISATNQAVNDIKSAKNEIEACADRATKSADLMFSATINIVAVALGMLLVVGMTWGLVYLYHKVIG